MFSQLKMASLSDFWYFPVKFEKFSGKTFSQNVCECLLSLKYAICVTFIRQSEYFLGRQSKLGSDLVLFVCYIEVNSHRSNYISNYVTTKVQYIKPS